MDLPVEDGTASVDDYADVVCGALERKHEDVVRVGHSYGGNTIPLVAHRRPVRQRVSCVVLVPGPNTLQRRQNRATNQPAASFTTSALSRSVT